MNMTQDQIRHDVRQHYDRHRDRPRHARERGRWDMADSYIDIVFDGPPSHESGRFVEVEDAQGVSICVGEWIERSDGFWVLRMPDFRSIKAENARLTAQVRTDQACAEYWRFRRTHNKTFDIVDALLDRLASKRVNYEQDIEAAARRGWNAGVYSVHNGDRIDGSDDVDDFVARYKEEREKGGTK